MEADDPDGPAVALDARSDAGEPYATVLPGDAHRRVRQVSRLTRYVDSSGGWLCRSGCACPSTMRTSCNRFRSGPFSADDANFLYFPAPETASGGALRCLSPDGGIGTSEKHQVRRLRPTATTGNRQSRYRKFASRAPKITGSSHRWPKTARSRCDYRKFASLGGIDNTHGFPVAEMPSSPSATSSSRARPGWGTIPTPFVDDSTPILGRAFVADLSSTLERADVKGQRAARLPCSQGKQVAPG